MQLSGSRVLITGAGHGLGLAIAKAFAKVGATVIVTDVDEPSIAEARKLLPGAFGYRLDVTNGNEIAEVRSRVISEHGSIDILVNNAGIVYGGLFLDVPLQQHIATVNVNVSGLLAVTHAFLPDLLTRPRAHVVHIASASAVIALPHAATYAATKWAVLGFTESLIEELRLLGKRNVGVSVICPSFITTGLFEGAKPTGLTRWLTPEEVAAAVVSAVENRREFVILPRLLHLFYSLAAGWPRRWFRAMCRAVGVNQCMIDWKGHTK